MSPTNSSNPSAGLSILDVFAPLSGPLVSLEQVPDPVFSQKLVGDGIAIDPMSAVVLAPCDGLISQLHRSHHAVTIAHASGAQILVHVGIDTVQLKGEGFKPLIKVGDQVTRGQKLIEFDADLLARRAKSLVSMMVLTEPPKSGSYQLSILGSRNAVAGQTALLAITSSATNQATSATKSIAGPKAESRAVEVRLATGLHARPAALLVAEAKKFSSHVEIFKGDRSANAKSVVGLLGLELSRGQKAQFRAEGTDAAIAVEHLAEFLSKLEEAESTHSAPAASTLSAPRSSAPGVIAGVAASPGLAIGRVHQMRTEAFAFGEHASDASAERSKLTSALQGAARELRDLRAKVAKQTDPTQAAIFAAHEELLEDPDLIEATMGGIDRGQSAAFAWNASLSSHAYRLSQLNNELMANRANDLRDVGRRVLRLLVGAAQRAPQELETGTILIADNLTPSDTVQLDREKILAFATTTGGATSHVAILARSLGLPALAGIEARALEISEGTEVVLDGDRGEIRLNPTNEEKKRVAELQQAQTQKRQSAMLQSREIANTRDGHHIEVAANIGGIEDAKKAVEMGCDGVGLLRSEFLFLERSTAPSEDEQYQVYQKIADILGSRPLTIRTLDVGGDKPLRYLPLPQEENPFLGVRGVRVGVQHPEIFREQLRAILRVRHQGRIDVMFPMIATLEELRWARGILEEERAKLGAPKVNVGIMIEVPSAALIADILAPEVDFFSIGTNDLTQYTLAMDRGHKDLAKLVDGLHPSVLRLIDMTTHAARRNGKWVGVCGGIAGDAKAVPILVGLGVQELSVSLPVIPLVKAQIRETSMMDAQRLAAEALTSPDAERVRKLTDSH